MESSDILSALRKTDQAVGALLTNAPGLPDWPGLGAGAPVGAVAPFEPVGFPAALLALNAANLFLSSSGVSILIFLAGRPSPGGGFPVASKRSLCASK